LYQTPLQLDSESIWAIITATNFWGDLTTNIQPRNLKRIGIKIGTKFTVRLEGRRYHDRGKEFKVLYGGNSFLSTKQGECLLLIRQWVHCRKRKWLL
jgi:S-adenosylmethionine hydrolase